MKLNIFSVLILVTQLTYAQSNQFEVDLNNLPTTEQATTVLIDFLKNTKEAEQLKSAPLRYD